MPEDAVIDAVVDEAVEAPLELGTETVTEGAEGEASTEPVAGAPLWQSIRESLKGADKATQASVRKAIFDATEVGKRHPEGLKGIDAVLESVKKLSADSETPDAVPVEQVIEETLAERGFWRDFDDKFQQGDASVITQMATANPEAFQSLMPVAIAKFAEVNPDGYSTLVAQAVVGYLSGAEFDIPLQIKLLDRIVPTESTDPAVQQLIESYGAIKKAFAGLQGMASKQIATPKVAATEKPAAQAQDDPDAPLRANDKAWNDSTVRPASDNFAVSEIQKHLGTGKLTEKEIAAVRGRIREEINARVAINAEYQKAIRAYLKANNKAAYTQRVISEHKKIISGGAAKRAVDDVLAARKAAPKVAAKVAVKTAAQLTTEPTEKFERIAGPPSTLKLKIDWKRQPGDWMVKRKAYVEGRKTPVTWGPK
jgi:hypothetical protein